MGAWGVQIFENDDACDWAYELGEVDDLSVVESALEAVEQTDDYLEAPDATVALAACECLARLKGRGGEKTAYTEPLDVWVGAHPLKPSPELLERARRVIQRVLAPDSELRDLWEETDDAAAWREAVEDLRNRLAS